MDISITISNLSAREADSAALILEDINKNRIQVGQPVFTSLKEFYVDYMRTHFEGYADQLTRTKGEIRREAWMQAPDAVRAQIDALLGIA